MDNHSYTADNDRPSALGSFFRKVISGASSGALMSVIVAGVSTVASGGLSAFTAAAFLSALAATSSIVIPATALFAGVMAVKHTLFDKTKSNPEYRDQSMIPVPVAGMTAPLISQSAAPSLDSNQQPPTQSWAATTGREGDSQSRIQQILANGSISDKDRAQAILAEREAANAASTQR